MKAKMTHHVLHNGKDLKPGQEVDAEIADLMVKKKYAKPMEAPKAPEKKEGK